MRRRDRTAIIAMATLVVAVGEVNAGRVVTQSQQPLGTFPLQVGITVQPETVTVGDPFVVSIRVRAPMGSGITFPPTPDSGSTVESLDPRVVRALADSTAVDQTASYRLVAWALDSQSVTLQPPTVTLRGVDRPVTLGSIHVVVRSVLPADTVGRSPKPARDIIEDVVPWWKRWWWLLPLMALLALLALLLWRRRRRQAVAPAENPLVLAEREFTRVEGMGLLEAGERGRFVALVVEIMRDYLAARIDKTIPGLTSTELLTVVASVQSVPGERLGAILTDADLIKFARYPISVDRARELAREARGIVRDVDQLLAQPAGQGAPPPLRAEAA
ncbi:MAG: hypothetical protein NVS4B3_18830 [Gemmatimonadaceae bacterium]